MIETDRLRLRRWRDDDLDALAAINADPEVMRYILDGAVRDRAQSADSLARMMRDWDERGFGLFAVERRDTGALLGWAGLAVPEFLPEVLPAVEIGWRLARPAWGRGYATEAAAAALRFAFEEHGLDRVISIRHVDNERSRRVMEKLGLTHEFDTVVPGHDQPVAVHALTRPRNSRTASRPGKPGPR
ncbi:GNAT family N-acetyltransferase [Paractinoplanes ferrugineus]|uniref:N-acetyltransferase n=1 Tax=Paractinoplanes ferrugineus TaxID=113564 RepID=A0A919IYG0_9ACTN|nr:GNAT family N-acetyltransferase [Actinoplanes ferrugineus]GIE10523.1 N-acetyltransferase [Actinoplanes ferrugineus]